MTAALSTGDLSVRPGQGTTGELHVHNASPDDTEFRFEIVGTPKEWGSVSPLRLRVGAHQEATARLSFHPPRSARTPPGPVGFEIRVVPVADPAAAMVVSGTIEIAAFTELGAALGPVRTTRRRASHQLTVDNRGNVPVTAAVRARSVRGGLLVAAAPSRVELAPGATTDVRVTVRAWRPRLRRPRAPAAFEVSVRPEGASEADAGTVRVEASMPMAPARRRRRPALAAVVVLALVAGFVVTRQDDDSGGPRPLSARNGIGTRTETFVDASRPTNAHGSIPAKPERSLRTLVYYPAVGPPGTTAVEGAAPAVDQGPYPLVVFGAGTQIEERYGELLRSWAASGYVVVAPTFPFSADPGERSLDDYPNQPADMSFVAREIVRLGADPAHPLGGLVDPERIGAAGVGLGGITTLGLAANTCCQDPQFKAAAVMAANQAAFGDGEYFKAPGPPLLVLHGDQDDTIPYVDARKTFTDSPGPAFLVTILGGGHGDPFIGPVNRPMNAVTLATTLAFFDRYLRGDTDATDRLRDEANVAGVARLERRD